MGEIARPGATINYEIWGEQGAWVTLINGHNRPLNDFRLCGRYLVEHGWRVLALDNRGAGKTVTLEPFTLLEMALDVAAIWEAEAITATHLLGISMGGMIAQLLASKKPAVVRRLVLVSTTMNERHIRRDDAPWSADPVAVEAKLLPFFTADFAARNAPLVRGMAKQIAKSVTEGDFVKMSEWQRQALAGLDLTSSTSALQMPTLILHGEADQVISIQAAKELATAIPGASLTVIPAAGHLLLAEKPRELYAITEGFLAKGQG